MLHFVLMKPIYQQVTKQKQLKQQEHRLAGTFKVHFPAFTGHTAWVLHDTHILQF